MSSTRNPRKNRRSHLRRLVERLEERQCPALTLTSAGMALGLTLTTFVSGFANQPRGAAFPTTGGALTTDDSGNVRFYSADADGQTTAAGTIAQNYGVGNAFGITQLNGKIYMGEDALGAVVQLNNDGTLNQTVATGLGRAVDLVVNPANGHLLVSTANVGIVYDVDPIAKTKTVFVNAILDGITLAPDGVLYGASDGGALNGHLLGYDTKTGNLVFDSGAIPDGIDGSELGSGALAGKIVINTNAGTLYLLDLTSKQQTLIASGGTRGDIANVDPNNFTMLLTQVDSIVRLSPNGDFNPTNPVPSVTGLDSAGVQEGTPGVNLGVIGTNFVRNTVVDFNGSPVPTTYVSATLLQAAIPASALADEGSAAVTAVTPGPGGGPSATSATFAIADTAVNPTGTQVLTPRGAPLGPWTVATFTDPGGSEAPASYGATIDWGDGTPATAGTITGPDASGVYSVSGSHPYSHLGGETITVRIAHGTAPVATTTSTTSVPDSGLGNPAGATVAAVEGQALSNVSLGSFDDADLQGRAADFTAQIDWGDGTISGGTVVANGVGNPPSPNTFDVLGNHTYARAGNFPVKVTVVDRGSSGPVVVAGVPVAYSDAGGSTATILATAAVGTAPLNLGALPVVATEGMPTAGGLVVANFTDSAGLTNPPEAYSATIDWGDGTTSVGLISSSGPNFSIAAPPHVYAEEGRYAVTVTLVDDDGGNGVFTTLARSAATVVDAPLAAFGAAVAATEGQAFTATPVATIADANLPAGPGDYTATIDWGDGTSSAGTLGLPAGGTVTVSGGHTYAHDGSYTVKTAIRDAGGASAVATGTATVGDAALVATSLGVSAVEGVASPVVVATFSDSNPAAPAATLLATIHWGDSLSSPGTITKGADGRFAVEGSHAYAASGAYPVSVTIGDAGGAGTGAGGTAIVTAPPLVASPFTVLAVEGQALDPSTPLATFSDPAGSDSPGNYSATIQWGDGSSTSGIVVPMGGSFLVQPDPAAPHAYAAAGSYALTVQVNDTNRLNNGAPDGLGFATSPVRVVDAPLTAAAPLALRGTAGIALAGVAVGGFTDPNASATPGDFAATIDWGDGTQSAGTVSGAAGAFTVAGTHTYASGGLKDATVNVVDPGGARASIPATVTVGNASLVATGLAVGAAEGAPLLAPLATFTDSNPLARASDLGATIDWGDGTSTTGLVAMGADGTFSVSGAHAYAEAGTYRDRVTVSEAGGTPTAAGGSAVVTDAPLAAWHSTLRVVEGAAVPQAAVLASFYDTGVAGAATDYAATIDWGDGSTTPGRVVPMGANAVVMPDPAHPHAYAEAGDATITVTIRDADGAADASVATVVSAVHVSGATPVVAGVAVAAVEGRAFAGVPVATVSDPNPFAQAGDFAATIDWGDGTSSMGLVMPSATPGGPFSVVGAHVYMSPGTRPVTATVAEIDGTSRTVATAAAAVADAPITATASTIRAAAGAPGAVSVGSFLDANPFARAGDFAATIHWGDGTTSPGQIAAAGAPGAFNVTGSHAYTQAGSYPLSFTVQDNVTPADAPAPGAASSSTTFSAPGNVTVLAAPTVVGFHRFGYHDRATTLVLTFDSALDPASASDSTNYRIVGPAPAANVRGRTNRIIGVDSAVYDPAAHTVTLSPHERLNVHDRYSLTVSGSAAGGVKGLNGLPIDGAHTGQPSSDYTASVDWSRLVILPNAPGVRASHVHQARVPSGPIAHRAASRRR